VNNSYNHFNNRAIPLAIIVSITLIIIIVVNGRYTVTLPRVNTTSPGKLPNNFGDSCNRIPMMMKSIPNTISVLPIKSLAKKSNTAKAAHAIMWYD
jgi:hypothetical protein